MGRFILFLAIGCSILLSCEAFFKFPHRGNVPIYIPKNLKEVKYYLCMKVANGGCVDDSPAKIILDQVFDFTDSQGMRTEVGCYHSTKPAVCLTKGQLKLDIVNQCDGLTPANVTYSVAGRLGIEVGSNKVIIGQNGGGLKGRGLRIKNVKKVVVKNLRITDINPHLIWGGDAIEVYNSTQIVLDGNYIKNIGRQFVVTHTGSNSVMMINNVFDGNTPYAAYCDGAHYWLWLFLGENERIILQNNVILNTAGRGPHLVAAKDSKTLLHMIQNTFYDIKDAGLIELEDSKSSILVEGNIFINVKGIVHINQGNIFMPQTEADRDLCVPAIGRQCLPNTVVNCTNDRPQVNSQQVLTDFGHYTRRLARPILMEDSITTHIEIPKSVKQHITSKNIHEKP